MERKVETIVTYIADDGSKFHSEEDCRFYEENCAGEYLKNLSFAIKELNYVSPINRKNISDLKLYNYIWFRLSCKEDFIVLKNALSKHNKSGIITNRLTEPTTYPDLLAIEMSMPHQLMAQERYSFTGQYYYFNSQKKDMEDYIERLSHYLEADYE